MGQISFSDAEYAGKRKKTRREVFLEEMELVVPWKALLSLIEPHYPVGGRGRKPYPLESMLRVHLMQNWFALSDPAMEEALYEIASLRSVRAVEPGRADPRRDDDPELPSPARSQRAGRGHPQGRERAPGEEGSAAKTRQHRRRHHHRRAELDQERRG